MEQLEQLEQIVRDRIDYHEKLGGKENIRSVTLEWVLEEIKKLKAEV